MSKDIEAIARFYKQEGFTDLAASLRGIAKASRLRGAPDRVKTSFSGLKTVAAEFNQTVGSNLSSELTMDNLVEVIADELRGKNGGYAINAIWAAKRYGVYNLGELRSMSFKEVVRIRNVGEAKAYFLIEAFKPRV